MSSHSYRAQTHGIRVTVAPQYLADESSPEENRYFFAYTIEITNLTSHPVQLLARNWRIVDGLGRLEEVHGAGVIGQTPITAPGKSFNYTSGCPLTTPHGTMEGSYAMTIVGGEAFEVVIPAFSLDSPLTHPVKH